MRKLALLFLVHCGQAQTASLTGASPAETSAAALARKSAVVWASADTPTESLITGGPWTLEQAGASLAAPSAGYCVSGKRQDNPGTQRMQPYYFPQVIGSGQHLQAFFDYRPQDLNEAIVAASSDDAGQSWQYQDQALELTKACPSSDADTNGGDDGQGHPYVAMLGGALQLYTLDRSAGNVDASGLVVHTLAPKSGSPLAAVPNAIDAAVHTSGLLAPDGIIAAVPGTNRILYLQKQLAADTSFPSAQQCAGKKANHDISTPRLAESDDGVSFTDLGPVAGLNDQTDTTSNGTRWIGPRGTLVLLAKNRYGLFFSAGNCTDNDSDALHYIGYAESSDLQNWTVVNDFDHPIASIGESAAAPIIGDPQGWFAGRVYAPNVSLLDAQTVTMIFAGYHVQKAGGGDYRTIGRATLSASLPLLGSSEDAVSLPR